MVHNYTDQAGDKYFELREARRDSFIQARRAAFFAEYADPSDTVIDFGCGTGGILSHINCARKIGVEVNPPSVKLAQAQGIEIVPDIKDLAGCNADLLISNHALEHVRNPADQISGGFSALRQHGRAVLVVPAEKPSARQSGFRQKDPDMHLFSWTPRTFANLVQDCGFEIEASYRRPIGHSKWLKPVSNIAPLYNFGRHCLAALLDRYEVVCIARKA